MASGLSTKLTGQIGEFLVCAELGRRGLIATPFAGNVPAFDVLAADDEGRSVPIQVETSRSEQWPSSADLWLKLEVVDGQQVSSGLTTIRHPSLIHVFVAIKRTQEGRDRSFVFTRATLQTILADAYEAYMEARTWRRPRTPSSFDCRLSASQIAEFEDDWPLVERQLRALPEPTS